MAREPAAPGAALELARLGVGVPRHEGGNRPPTSPTQIAELGICRPAESDLEMLASGTVGVKRTD